MSAFTRRLMLILHWQLQEISGRGQTVLKQAETTSQASCRILVVFRYAPSCRQTFRKLETYIWRDVGVVTSRLLEEEERG